MSFKKAERLLSNPTLAITGPAGSGKTFSGLRLAAGIAKAMQKRFAVIDSENGSASLYSHLFDFDTLEIKPPFTTEKYIAAINEAEKGGYCALLCDSITHAWAGEGGLLEQKAKLDERPGSNHWTNWNPIKKKDLQFRNAFLHSSIPFFIATIRSKMEYAQSEDGNKKKVQIVGMAPVQSDGIEYEFSVAFDLAMNHEAAVSKDRTHIFDQAGHFQITEDIGLQLVNWRASGKVPPPKPIADADAEPQFSPPDDFQQHPSDEPDLDVYFGEPDSAHGSVKIMNQEKAGNYTITFGQFKGKMLNELPEKALRDYCNHLQASRSTHKSVVDLLANAAILLGLE